MEMNIDKALKTPTCRAGNITVFCKCRPLNGSSSTVIFNPSMENEIRIICSDSSTKKFKFDHVFSPEDDQDAVLGKVSPILTSVLDGHNVCIFSYGQAGTGNVFTTEGTFENRGISYRTFEELFRISNEKSNDMKYELSLSMFEFYNEKIRDLLAENRNQPAKKLEIKQAREGTEEVLGLVETRVDDTDAVWKLIKDGNQARSPNANQLSSQSHCLLRVIVQGENLTSKQKTRRILWLVDLAGSERVGCIKVERERLGEIRFVNKSISALGDVLYALASKKAHIPYRNSKLTHMLQSSLGGDCKTLMIVQISPTAADLRGTLSCLKFASRVRGIEHGPTRKVIQETACSWPFMGLTLEQQKDNARKQMDIIVGIFDSGICMKSKSFSDEGITPLEEGKFPPSNALGFKPNNKVIAANCYYFDNGKINIDEAQTITDYSGHGTNCASIIVGNLVHETGYGSVDKDRCIGGVPAARLSVYKFSQPMFYITATKDAIQHGVSILSISQSLRTLSRESVKPWYMNYEIAEATLLATVNGLLACVASGNIQVRNIAPWEMDVGACNSPYVFQTDVLLMHVEGPLKGYSINPNATEFAPLIFYSQAKLPKVDELDPDKVRGKILVCNRRMMATAAFEAGAVGMIARLKEGEEEGYSSSNTFPLPAACVRGEDINTLNNYMKRHRREAKARFLVSVPKSNEDFPCVAKIFVDSEADIRSEDFIKPDICAIGVDVLVANSQSMKNEKRPPYSTISGTSVAAPMVAAAAAYVKSLHPTWSPSAIKSALMTTATAMKFRTMSDVRLSGSGLINVDKALDPGLVYDIDALDYLRFLQGQGCLNKDLKRVVGVRKVRELSGTDPIHSCDLNYPSFKACLSGSNPSQVFRRKLKDVGLNKEREDKIYKAHVKCPEGVKIEVKPMDLSFVTGQEMSFEMDVTVTDWSKAEENVFSAILEWKSRSYNVKSPILIVQRECLKVDKGESSRRASKAPRISESEKGKGKMVEEYQVDLNEDEDFV